MLGMMIGDGRAMLLFGSLLRGEMVIVPEED